MNKDNILRLADALEKNEFTYLDFKMQVISEPKGKDPACGSACCIIGYTLACKNGLFEAPNRDGELVYKDDPMVTEAAQYLGISPKKADKLFFPDWHKDKTGMSFYDLHNVTKEDAANVLRGLAETGKVSWKEVSARLHPAEGG